MIKNLQLRYYEIKPGHILFFRELSLFIKEKGRTLVAEAKVSSPYVFFFYLVWLKPFSLLVQNKAHPI